MQPCNVFTGAMGPDELSFNLIERHGCGVNDSRVAGAMCEQLGWDQGPGKQTYRAAGEKVAAANGDQVGGARAGANEVDGHDVSAPSASAQVTGPITIRGPRSRAVGPLPAS